MRLRKVEQLGIQESVELGDFEGTSHQPVDAWPDFLKLTVVLEKL